MNNKSILVFIIATLLALLCAFFIMKRTDNKIPYVENSVNIQEEIITPAEQEQKTEVEDDDAPVSMDSEQDMQSAARIIQNAIFFIPIILSVEFEYDGKVPMFRI